MGFMSDLIEGFTTGLSRDDIHGINEILEMEYDDDDYNVSESNYRKIATKYTASNNGWYECPKCHRKYRLSDMDADHIVPKSKGGDHSTYNMQLLCKHCNRSKQADMTDTREDLRRRKQEIEEEHAKDVALLAYLMKECKKTDKGVPKNGKKRKK